MGSSNFCKIYEQQYKQTVDGSKRVPEAARRESLAITAQSITCSMCHIQPQAPQQCNQNIFSHSHDRSDVTISYCGTSWFDMCEDIQPCNLHMPISLSMVYGLSMWGLLKQKLLCNDTLCNSQAFLYILLTFFLSFFNLFNLLYVLYNPKSSKVRSMRGMQINMSNYSPRFPSLVDPTDNNDTSGHVKIRLHFHTVKF